MNIKGTNITLRAIEETDLELLNLWANDPEIQYWLGGWHFPTSLKNQKEWFNSLSIKSNNQRFIIEHNELGTVGTANLVNIDWKNRNAFHGMLLGGVDIRGKGVGSDVVISIMKYAFDELGLNRLDGSIIEYNKASIRLYTEKCGWKIEGVKKNWYFRKNKFWNKLIVGITKKEYNEFVSNNR